MTSAAAPSGRSRAPAIRPATEADAAAIRGLVRGANLNPRDLHWRRFLVADDAGTVVACAQVRVHRRGTRELASVAVAPGRQGEGIGRAISEAVIGREPVRPLYLYTEHGTEPYWGKFAFRTIDGEDIPRDLRGPLRFVRAALGIYNLVKRTELRIIVMRRDRP